MSRPSGETVKRRELVGRLNPTCLKAFSEAAQTAITGSIPTQR